MCALGRNTVKASGKITSKPDRLSLALSLEQSASASTSPSGWTQPQNRSLFVLMQMEAAMYVVFAKELESGPPNPRNSARTLDEAFARICCRCGLSYEFFPEEDGWRLQLTDVAQPQQSPAPIRSRYHASKMPSTIF